MQEDPKFIYDRRRALLGGKLPVEQFQAAQALIEGLPAVRNNFATAIQAVPPTMLQTMSRDGRKLLQQLEGLRLTAYRDSAGIWTIGYGNTYHPDGRPVKAGDSITATQADEYMIAVLPKYENTVRKIITAPLTQNQFDALVCFVYNIGSTAFLNSSVDDKINAGNIPAALSSWAAHNKVRNPTTGKLAVSQGIVNRRNAEIALFNKKEV